MKSLIEPSLGDPEPILVSSQIVIGTTKPVAQDLLCAECEDLFSKNGEAWVSQIIARLGSFPLCYAVETCPKIKETPDLTLFACRGNAAINIDKLAYFALSMFWRSSIVNWRAIANVPRIELGEYEEPIRRFLRGEAAIPPDCVLIATLWTHQPSNLQVILPAESHENQPFRIFSLKVPGIQIALLTGAEIPQDARNECMYSSSNQIIGVSGSIDMVLIKQLQTNFHGAHRAAKIAAKYGDYLKGQSG
jgi:hypothetical protein